MEFNNQVLIFFFFESKQLYRRQPFFIQI